MASLPERDLRAKVNAITNKLHEQDSKVGRAFASALFCGMALLVIGIAVLLLWRKMRRERSRAQKRVSYLQSKLSDRKQKMREIALYKAKADD